LNLTIKQHAPSRSLSTIQIARSEKRFRYCDERRMDIDSNFTNVHLAVYFMIERFTLISSVSKIDQGFIDEICKRIKEKDFTTVRELGKKYAHPIGQVINIGFENPKLPAKGYRTGNG